MREQSNLEEIPGRPGDSISAVRLVSRIEDELDIVHDVDEISRPIAPVISSAPTTKLNHSNPHQRHRPMSRAARAVGPPPSHHPRME